MSVHAPPSIISCGQKLVEDLGVVAHVIDQVPTEVVDPATRQLVAEIPPRRSRMCGRSLERCAAPSRSGLIARRMSAALRCASSADIIRANAELAAGIITLESGKPLAEAAGEVAAAASFIETAAADVLRLDGTIVQSNAAERRLFVTNKPVGPVLAVTPWNFPLALAARKVGPALAAGNPVLLKPADQTPLSALLLLDFALQAGLTNDELQVLTGDGPSIVASAISEDAIRMVSFTGSSAAGESIMRLCSRSATGVTLELGGSAPFIVTATADLVAAAEAAVSVKFRNAGQTCVAPNRFLVHESRYENFVQLFLEADGRPSGRLRDSPRTPLSGRSSMIVPPVASRFTCATRSAKARRSWLAASGHVSADTVSTVASSTRR